VPHASSSNGEFGKKITSRSKGRVRRFSLYTDRPDDDLGTCLFDPREDEDPPLEPPAEAPAKGAKGHVGVLDRRPVCAPDFPRNFSRTR
jgi:hypothetical protein